MINKESLSNGRCGVNRDAYYSFGTHFPPRVLRVVDEEWRADKLVMPDVPIQPTDLPPEENENHQVAPEDSNVWKDLSIQEMVNLATTTVQDRENSEQNEFSISGFYLDSNFFNHHKPLI